MEAQRYELSGFTWREKNLDSISSATMKVGGKVTCKNRKIHVVINMIGINIFSRAKKFLRNN